MKVLLQILFGLFILIFIIPLAWVLLKEIFFFFGAIITSGALGGIIAIAVIIICLIYIISK